MNCFDFDMNPNMYILYFFVGGHLPYLLKNSLKSVMVTKILFLNITNSNHYLVGHQTVMQEVEGLSPGQTNTHGLKN